MTDPELFNDDDEVAEIEGSSSSEAESRDGDAVSKSVPEARKRRKIVHLSNGTLNTVQMYGGPSDDTKK